MIPRFHGVGNIGAAPQVTKSKNGTLIANINVAFSETYNGEQQTVWMKCTAFGGRAEIIQKYFNKGDRIELICKLSQEQYTDKNGNNRTNIVGIVEQIGFIETKSKETKEKQKHKKTKKSAPPKPDEHLDVDVDEDDIPF